MIERSTISREPVQVRSFDLFVSGEAEVSIAKIVGYDDDDVRRRCSECDFEEE